MKLKKIFNDVFVRFMISYLVILFLVMFICGIAYNASYNIAKDESIKNGLVALKKSSENIDMRFKEIENMITQISLNKEIVSALNHTYPVNNSDYYDFHYVSSRIDEYCFTNSFIDDLYIYFKNSDFLVSSEYIANNTSYFNKKFLNYENISYLKWKEKLTNDYEFRTIWSEENITINDKKSTVLTYIQSIPIGYFDNYKGVSFVLINKDKILDLITNTDMHKHASVYILDRNGNNITSSKKDENLYSQLNINFETESGFEKKKINGENMIQLHTYSDYMGWTYVAILPTKIIEEQVKSIKVLFIGTIVFSVLIGIIIAVTLSYRNSKPIKQLVVKIKGLDEGVKSNQTYDNFNLIEGTITDLVMRKRELQNELDNQKPFIRANFYEGLLRGEQNTIEEISVGSKYTKFNAYNDYYGVILVRINGYYGNITNDVFEEVEMSKVVIKNVLAQKFILNHYIHHIDKDKIAIILSFAKNQKDKYENIEENLGEIIDELNGKYSIKVSFAIGEIYKNVIEVSKSFQEALKAINYKVNGQLQKVVWFKDIPKTNQGYYYPIEIEARLINLTKAGMEKEVVKILNEIYQNNFRDNKLSNRDAEQLIFEIRGTIIKIKNELQSENEKKIEFNDLLEKMKNCQFSDEIYSCIIEIYNNLCQMVNERKNQQSKLVLDQIIEYIHSYYMDDSLCLYKVATEFDFTEKYLSQFFKDNIGTNFSVYIEKIRMEKAANLLNETKLSVADIAKRVGYSNNNTFYKAFKRVYALSPTVYRSNSN